MVKAWITSVAPGAVDRDGLNPPCQRKLAGHAMVRDPVLSCVIANSVVTITDPVRLVVMVNDAKSIAKVMALMRCEVTSIEKADAETVPRWLTGTAKFPIRLPIMVWVAVMFRSTLVESAEITSCAKAVSPFSIGIS